MERRRGREKSSEKKKGVEEKGRGEGRKGREKSCERIKEKGAEEKGKRKRKLKNDPRKRIIKNWTEMSLYPPGCHPCDSVIWYSCLISSV